MAGTFHVGANVAVLRDGKILLGLRKGYGEGTWGMPGGHVEPRELLEDAARRELLEETGIVVSQLELVSTVNQPFRNEQDRHYIQFMFRAIDAAGEPENLEPYRCYEWQWFDLKNLPENIFPPHKTHLSHLVYGGHFAEDINVL
jgi:8-oxo-dGTP diphosphatase